jgi:hypothetical protein
MLRLNAAFISAFIFLIGVIAKKANSNYGLAKNFVWGACRLSRKRNPRAGGWIWSTDSKSGAATAVITFNLWGHVSNVFCLLFQFCLRIKHFATARTDFKVFLFHYESCNSAKVKDSLQ